MCNYQKQLEGASYKYKGRTVHARPVKPVVRTQYDEKGNRVSKNGCFKRHTEMVKARGPSVFTVARATALKERGSTRLDRLELERAKAIANAPKSKRMTPDEYRASPKYKKAA